MESFTGWLRQLDSYFHFHPVLDCSVNAPTFVPPLPFCVYLLAAPVDDLCYTSLVHRLGSPRQEVRLTPGEQYEWIGGVGMFLLAWSSRETIP